MPKSKSKSSRKKPNNHRAHDTARKRRASPFLRSLPVRPKQLEYLRERAKSHLTKMFLGTADKLDLVFLNYLFEATGPLCANFDAADDIMAELARRRRGRLLRAPRPKGSRGRHSGHRRHLP